MSISSSSSWSTTLNGGSSSSSCGPSIPANGFISGSFKAGSWSLSIEKSFSHGWPALKHRIASSSLSSTEKFKAHVLKDLETSSGVNSSDAFTIHLIITQRGGDCWTCCSGQICGLHRTQRTANIPHSEPKNKKGK